MVRVLSVDPGSTKSGWCLLEDGVPVDWRSQDNNEEFIVELRSNEHAVSSVVCEWYEPRHGQPTGLDHANTWRWVGRFQEAFGNDSRFHLIQRRDVKMNLVGNTRAKDRDIAAALDDRFGGRSVARGAKKCPACKGKGWAGRGRPPCADCGATGWEQPPGPLAGITGHAVQALAVGITYLDRQNGAHQ